MNRFLKRSYIILMTVAVMIISSTCSNPFSAGLGDEVDIEAPKLDVTSHNNGDFVGAAITLSGTVTDDGIVESVGISLDTAANSIGKADIDGSSWSFSYDTSAMSDGDHEFLIKATDDTSKTVSLKLLLTVDNNPPSVLVTSPSEYGTEAGDPEFNKSITIKGEASDTTRVKEVWISLYDNAGTSMLTGGEVKAIGTSSWYKVINTEDFHPSTDPAADYYFFVRAVDNSGNFNSYFFHFEDILNNSVDPAATPSIEEINSVIYQGVDEATLGLTASLDSLKRTTTDGERMDITINPDSDQPRFTIINPAEGSSLFSENIFSSPQRLSGFVEDDDLAGIDESTLKITITNDDTAAVVETTYNGASTPEFTLSGNTWTYESSLVDGNYWVELYVKDAGGVEGFSSTVPFQVSSFAPVVSLDSPQQGVYIGKGSTTTVQVTVTGASGDEVFIDLNNDGSYDADEKMNILGGGLYDFDIEAAANPPVLDTGENFVPANGEATFLIRAGVTPNFGTASLQYTGDISDPSVTISYPPDASNMNGAINISGTASDNFIIEDVYVWVGTETDPALLPTDFENADTDSAAALASGDWIIPTGTYNWAVSGFDTNLLTDNTDYTIFVKAFDAAGNGSDLSAADASLTFTVNQESDRPVISLSNMVEGGSSNGLAQDASIIGLVEDDDLVDVSTLEVRVDINNDGSFTGVDLNSDGFTGDNPALGTTDDNELEEWSPVSNRPADDTMIVSWSHSLLYVPQGTHSMQIRVHDSVSDGVTNDEGTNPNYAELNITEFIIDYGPPDLVITTPASGTIFNSDFTIEGTATDPNNVTDVEISFDGGNTYDSLYNDAAGTGTVNWIYNFTVDSVDGGDGYTTDGDYSYQIRATDSSGGKTTKDRQLVVDAEPPTLAFEQPDAGADVNGISVPVRGTGNDNRGITAVYIDINEEGTDPPADLASWDTVTGLYSWTYSFDSTSFNNTVTPGNYVISLIAVDSAGNESVEYTRTVSIDQPSDRPLISFNDIDKDETDPAINVLVGATTLTGLVEDDDLIDPSLFSGGSIEISIDGSVWENVSNPPSASGKLVVWKHDISGLTEGLHYVKVRARDNQSNGTVGASSISGEYSSNFNWNIEDSSDQGGVPFILNLGPPSVSITAPANYSYHNSDVTITGVAADANGVDSVELGYDADDSGIIEADEWSAVSGFIPGSTSDDWTYTFAVTGSNDGTYSYTVRAEDSYGSTGVESGMFTVDATVPTAVINLPDDGATVNGQLTFSGTAGDNISLSKVYYYIGGPIDTPLFPDDYTLFSGTYSWSDTVDTTPTGLGDGNFTLRVGSQDSAGNYSLISTADFTVDQASDRPVISLSSILEAGTFSENLLPASKQIGGTITDDDRVDVSTIEYQLYAEDGTTLLIDWNTVSGAPGINTTLATWTHIIPEDFIDTEDSDGDFNTTETISITDGKYQIRFRSADIYDTGPFTPGDYTWSETGLVQISIDTANPVTTFDTSNGGSTNTDVVISGTASDANGVSTVEIGYDVDGGGTIDSDEWFGASNFIPDSLSDAWDYTYTVDTSGHSDDGQFTYKVKITDVYAKEQVYDRYITIDTTPASVTISQPASGSDVNGTITLRGTSSDTGAGVAKVQYGVTTSDTVAPAYSDALGIYNWSATYDTTAVVGPTTYYLWVQAEDLAGNISTPSIAALTIRDFNIDQASDRPVIEFSSITEGGTFGDNELPLSKKISGTIEDDDGVDASTVQFQLYQEDGTTLIDDWTNVSGQPASDTTFTSWSHTLGVTGTSVSDGKYQIRLRAADTNDAGAFDGLYDWSVSDLQQITIDSFFPTGSIDSLDVSSFYDASIENRPAVSGMLINNSFDLNGTASDGNGIDSVKFSTNGIDYTEIITGTFGTFDGTNWSCTVPIDHDGTSDGSLTLYIRIEDTVGKITDKTLTVTIDTVEPSTTLNYTSEMELQAGVPTIDGPLAKIIGSVTDTGTISNVDRVDLFFVKGTDFYSPRADESTATGGDSIPSDSTYIISVDNRFEIDDDTESPGDNDGFLEGLRSKGSYDEWYVYIDSTILPDGPISLQQASYDASGNRNITSSGIQISNYPPSIDSISIWGTAYTDDDVRVKLDHSGIIDIDASDDTHTPTGINTGSYELEIIEQYTRDGGEVGSLNNSYNAADTYLFIPDASGAYTLNLDTVTPALTDDYFYRVQARVKDVSDNVVTKDFYMWVYDSSSDSSAPTLTIDSLTQNNTGSDGHIEEAADSPNDSADADISGTITFTGTIYDDNSSPSVDLQVSVDGTNWTTLTTGLSVTELTSGGTGGYYYDWSYTWDTSLTEGFKTDVTVLNLQVRALGTDTSANTGNSSAITVDIVPYITKVLNGFNTGLLAYGQRSALGVYPVASDSTITITGYNLYDPVSGDNSMLIDTDIFTPTGSSESIDVDLSAGNDISGDVTVKVNGISSQNNDNDNGSSQNRESNLFNDNLTDDRSVAYWNMRSHDLLQNKTDAVMGLNAAQTGVEWMYVDGGNYLLYTNGSLNGNAYMTDGFAISGGGFAYNTSGTLMWIYLHNAAWTQTTDWAHYGSVQWGKDVTLTRIDSEAAVDRDATTAYNWHLEERAFLGLGNMCFINDIYFDTDLDGVIDNPDFNVTAIDSQLNRYNNMKIRLSGDDTDTMNHVAYRDTSLSAKGIVYYGYHVGTGAAFTNTTSLDATATWTSDLTKTVTSGMEAKAYIPTGTDDKKATGVKTPTDHRGTVTTDRATYFDMQITSAGVAVVAWYDLNSNSLKLAYNTDPSADPDNWIERTNPVDTLAGSYVSMAIDPDDGIHLAYLDGQTSYLKYSYLDSYDTADINIKTVIVDGLLSSGQYNSITIRDFGTGDYRPVISTISTSFAGTKGAVRAAWPVTNLAGISAGSDTDGIYTGAWEVMFVPATVVPQTEPTFVEVLNNTDRDFTIGYNGTNLEEATYLGF